MYAAVPILTIKDADILACHMCKNEKCTHLNNYV